MMMKAPFVAVAAALALLAPATMAQEKKAADNPAAATSEAKKAQGASSAADRPAAGQQVAAAAPGAGSGAVRDWAAIDTNKDNLISPDEMQKYLEAEWKAQKK